MRKSTVCSWVLSGMLVLMYCACSEENPLAIIDTGGKVDGKHDGGTAKGDGSEAADQGKDQAPVDEGVTDGLVEGQVNDLVEVYDAHPDSQGEDAVVTEAGTVDGFVCTPSTFIACNTTTQMLQCNEQGTGTILIECSPFFCDSLNGRCSQCDPSVILPSCAADLLTFCSPDGLLIVTQCPDGCQNGACNNCTISTYFRDFDNDGYGDPNVTIDACNQPTGYVLNNEDCDDIDPAAHPGQTAYFNVPTKGTNTYDYNCKDGDEPEFPSAINCVESGTTCVGDGWVGDIPACGEMGMWGKCNKQGSGIPGCGQTTSVKIQSCH